MEEHLICTRRLKLHKPAMEKEVQFVSSNEVEIGNHKKLLSVFNYDILINFAYNSRFVYTPSWTKDRLSYIAVPDYEIQKKDMETQKQTIKISEKQS